MKKILILTLFTLSSLCSAMDNNSAALKKAEAAISEKDIDALAPLLRGTKFTSAQLQSLQKTAEETRWFSVPRRYALLGFLGGGLITAGLWFDTSAAERLYTCEGLSGQLSKYCSCEAQNSTGLVFEYFKSLVPTVLYCSGALMTTAAVCGMQNKHKVIRFLLTSELQNAQQLETTAQRQAQSDARISELNGQIRDHASTISKRDSEISKANQQKEDLKRQMQNFPTEMQKIRESSQAIISRLEQENGQFKEQIEKQKLRLRKDRNN